MNAARPFAVGAVRATVILATLSAVLVVRSPAPTMVLAAVVLGAAASVWLFDTGAASVRAWSLYLAAFALFAYLRRLTDELGVAPRFGYVIDADTLLGFGRVPTVWLQQHLHTPGHVGAIDVLTIAVYLSYFLVPHVVAFVLWKANRSRFVRYGSEVLICAYAGLLVSAIVPTAPPWLAGQRDELPFVAKIVSDAVGGFDPTVYRSGYEIVGVNPVAAMPSLHMALTTLVAIAAWQRGRVVAAVGAGYAMAMGFSLVYLGEHYVTDVILGAVLAVAVSLLIGRAFFAGPPRS
jgi:membrane-associated phospholipid phosphatase